MMQTGRPATVPTPVTTPSAGVSGSWLRANSQSSWNSVPGSSKSFSRSRTKSLPSARSLSRYLTCPCSIRARSRKYRSSPSPTPSSALGCGPDDHDQDAVGVTRAPDDDGRAGTHSHGRGQLHHGASLQAHFDARRVAAGLSRTDLERTLAGDRPPLRPTDRRLPAIL